MYIHTFYDMQFGPTIISVITTRKILLRSTQTWNRNCWEKERGKSYTSKFYLWYVFCQPLPFQPWLLPLRATTLLESPLPAPLYTDMEPALLRKGEGQIIYEQVLPLVNITSILVPPCPSWHQPHPSRQRHGTRIAETRGGTNHLRASYPTGLYS